MDAELRWQMGKSPDPTDRNVGTRVAAQIAPMDDAIGKRICYCQQCDHYTWADWRGSLQEGQANTNDEAE